MLRSWNHETKSMQIDVVEPNENNNPVTAGAVRYSHHYRSDSHGSIQASSSKSSSTTSSSSNSNSRFWIHCLENETNGPGAIPTPPDNNKDEPSVLGARRFSIGASPARSRANSIGSNQTLTTRQNNEESNEPTSYHRRPNSSNSNGFLKATTSTAIGVAPSDEEPDMNKESSASATSLFTSRSSILSYSPETTVESASVHLHQLYHNANNNNNPGAADVKKTTLHKTQHFRKNSASERSGTLSSSSSVSHPDDEMPASIGTASTVDSIEDRFSVSASSSSVPGAAASASLYAHQPPQKEQQKQSLVSPPTVAVKKLAPVQQDAYQWAYDVWRRKGLMNAASKGRTVGAVLTQAGRLQQQQQKDKPKLVGGGYRRSTFGGSSNIANNNNNQPAIPLVTPRESFVQLNFDDQVDAKKQQQQRGAGGRAGSSNPGRGKGGNFANILQKWKTKSEDGPNGHFLSPDQDSHPAALQHRPYYSASTTGAGGTTTATNHHLGHHQSKTDPRNNGIHRPSQQETPQLVPPKVLKEQQAMSVTTNISPMPPSNLDGNEPQKMESSSAVPTPHLEKTFVELSDLNQSLNQPQPQTASNSNSMPIVSQKIASKLRERKDSADDTAGSSPLGSPKSQATKIKERYIRMRHPSRPKSRGRGSANEEPDDNNNSTEQQQQNISRSRYSTSKSPARTRGGFKNAVHGVLKNQLEPASSSSSSEDEQDRPQQQQDPVSQQPAKLSSLSRGKPPNPEQLQLEPSARPRSAPRPRSPRRQSIAQTIRQRASAAMAGTDSSTTWANKKQMDPSASDESFSARSKSAPRARSSTFDVGQHEEQTTTTEKVLVSPQQQSGLLYDDSNTRQLNEESNEISKEADPPGVLLQTSYRPKSAPRSGRVSLLREWARSPDTAATNGDEKPSGTRSKSAPRSRRFQRGGATGLRSLSRGRSKFDTELQQRQVELSPTLKREAESSTAKDESTAEPKLDLGPSSSRLSGTRLSRLAHEQLRASPRGSPRSNPINSPYRRPVVEATLGVEKQPWQRPVGSYAVEPENLQDFSPEANAPVRVKDLLQLSSAQKRHRSRRGSSSGTYASIPSQVELDAISMAESHITEPRSDFHFEDPTPKESPFTKQIVSKLEKIQSPDGITPRNMDPIAGKPWQRDRIVNRVGSMTNTRQSIGVADNEEDGVCQCANTVFPEKDDSIEFFLPLMGTGCTCGKGPKGLRNPEEPTAIENILRPWQAQFLAGFGIYRGDHMVKAHHRSANALATALRQYRKKQKMTPFRTKSCAMALQIWSKTCRAFVRSIRKQLTSGTTELKLPNTLYILSSFLEKLPCDDDRPQERSMDMTAASGATTSSARKSLQERAAAIKQQQRMHRLRQQRSDEDADDEGEL